MGNEDLTSLLGRKKIRDLTKQQQLLLNGLDLYKVEKGAMIGIMISLQKPEQMDELMSAMAKNPQMTQEEILLKTAEIANITESQEI